MKTLFEPKTLVEKILGSQKINSSIQYRQLYYLKSVEVNDGLLLMNLLTYELIYLTESEAELLNLMNLNNEVIIKLIEKWFLVPENHDDLSLLKQVESMMCFMNKSYTLQKYQTFTILPTTDCNARCFYCFENGASKIKMSPLVATDVANYILNHKTDSKIYLRWFGGEPLYNSEVIDIICQKLSDESVDYESYMISNGYLFNEQMVAKAVSLWHLSRIQITIDGTEEKYNRIKNYIYNDGSAYLKVMNNIELLLKEKINVRIRMNLDQYNIDDIYKLTDELFIRFKDEKNLRIYSALIFEESCAHMKNADSETRRKLLEKQVKLEKYIIQNGKYALDAKIHKNRFGHCMADDNQAIMILPDGNLGKCQSFVDSNYIGNIYNPEIDYKMVNWYKDIKTVSKECDNCIFRMACVYPKCCIMSLQNCTDLDKQLISNRLEKQMLKCYENFIIQ